MNHPTYLPIHLRIISGLSLCLIFAFLAGCSRGKTGASGTTAKAEEKEDSLSGIAEILNKGTDANSCMSVLGLCNTFRSEHPRKPPVEMSPEEDKLIREKLGVDSKTMEEITGKTYTRLDSHYLDSCFLFRDAARSLGVDGMNPRDQAAAAFAWASREVRIVGSVTDLRPPQY